LITNQIKGEKLRILVFVSIFLLLFAFGCQNYKRPLKRENIPIEGHLEKPSSAKTPEEKGKREEKETKPVQTTTIEEAQKIAKDLNINNLISVKIIGKDKNILPVIENISSKGDIVFYTSQEIILYSKKDGKIKEKWNIFNVNINKQINTEKGD